MRNLSKFLVLVLFLSLTIFTTASCEVTQEVKAATASAPLQDVDVKSLLNNWNFSKNITNDQANSPYDWWIWEGSKYGVGSAKVSAYGVKDGYVFIRIADSGSDTWNIQFNQWVKLKPTTAYYISFSAKADEPKKINHKILQTHDPWTNYFSKTIELTPEWKTFEFYYVHGEKADEVVTFGFELGKTENTTVYFKDIILKEIPLEEVPEEFRPVEETETVEYEFEDEEEPDNLVNNGDFSYKIVNDQGSMPNEWWIWQASQYGISSAKVASYGVVDGIAFIELADTGTESWHLQFNQWVKLRKGNSYIVSFKARADIPRTINVKLVQTGAPYGQFFAETVDLTTEWQTFTFEYTHPEKGDPVVNLSFELGKDVPTTIYFDDIVIAPKK